MLNIAPTPLVIEPPAGFLENNPNIRSLARQLSIKYAHDPVTDNDLRQMGQALWQGLDLDAQLQEQAVRQGSEIIPVIIRHADPEILALPWECLYHPEQGFIAAHPGFTLSRRAAGADADPVQPKGPLKVLLFTSLPDDVDPIKGRLDVESEQGYVLEALDGAIKDGLVELTAPDDGTFATFKRLMRGGGFHLVYLSGHGSCREDPIKEPEAFFLFEDESGRSRPVSAPKIAKIFFGSDAQCVVVSACESAKRPFSAPQAGMVANLAAGGVPHVVGMRESVMDKAGLVFASEFCQALVRRERLDTAVQAARTRLAGDTDDSGGIAKKYGDEISVKGLHGQWCLPLLYSRNAARPLIDWEFEPAAKWEQAPDVTGDMGEVALPERFIGRRTELRDLSRALDWGTRQILVTGPGGQGKTALAGKLAMKLQAGGYLVAVFSARAPADWNSFIFNLQLNLAGEHGEKVDRMWGRCPDEQARATLVLTALQQQTGGRLVLFLDNLEDAQDPDTLEIRDENIRAWLRAAEAMGAKSPIMLLTSRWLIKPWRDERGPHHQLRRPSYGDFLRYTQELNLKADRERLRDLYRHLGGNFKAVQLFRDMRALGADQDEFLRNMARVKDEMQAHMAIQQVIEQLDEPARRLLANFRVFNAPVPAEAAVLVGRDLPEPRRILARLAGFSLLDREIDHELRIPFHSLAPIVADWLEQNEPPVDRQLRRDAAKYLRWLFNNLQPAMDLALKVHESLTGAGLSEEAHGFAVSTLVPYFDSRAMFRVLLTDWLPGLLEAREPATLGAALGYAGKACLHISDYETALQYLKQSLNIRREIGDKSGEGTTLNNISQIYDARGDYDTALQYLKQSLNIRREIGDKSGEGTTLNNISQIFKARGDYETALQYLKQSLNILREIGDKSGMCATLFNIGHIHLVNEEADEAMSCFIKVYLIARQIGYHQALAALAGLTKDQGGLEYWENLANQIKEQENE